MSDWIEWKGGDQPVDDDVCVEIRMETLALWDGKAAEFSWEHMDDGGNIIAHRILKEPAA